MSRTITMAMITPPITMATTSFSLQDKLEKVWFFQKTFLVANTRTKIILGMSFLTLGCADIRFAESLPRGLTRLQTAKRVKFFSAKNLQRPPEDLMKPFWLGLRGQECPRHDSCQVFGSHQYFPFRLRNGTTQAHQPDFPSGPPVLQYYSSTGKAVAFDYAFEVSIAWLSITSIRCLWLRL